MHVFAMYVHTRNDQAPHIQSSCGLQGFPHVFEVFPHLGASVLAAGAAEGSSFMQCPPLRNHF